MKKWFLFIPMLAVLLAACNSDDVTSTDTTDPQKTDDTLSIYTTVYPLQYFAQQIGGKAVSVSSIYPAGANAKRYDDVSRCRFILLHRPWFRGLC